MSAPTPRTSLRSGALRRGLARSGLVAVTLSASAAGYDSKCRISGGAECTPGIETARNRWTAADSEHRLLWEDAVRGLNLPAHLTSLVELRVPTDSSLAVVGSAGVSASSVRPFPFAKANALASRSYTIGEMAQLPDLSYSLWDWAYGNETCPLQSSLETDICHNFKYHMGTVNSSHFLPQAEAFFTYYHDLAMGRAKACGEMRSKLGTTFSRYVEQCDQEALTYEAIGHHYLQDAWSMGHMWERWGGPDLSDFGTGPDARGRALLVGASSGLIHGSKGLLQPLVGNGFDVRDPMCAPLDPAAERGCSGVLCSNAPDFWRTLDPPSFVDGADGSLNPGVGDLYYDDLRNLGYGHQYGRLEDCSRSSILAVLNAAGIRVTGTSPAPDPSDPNFSTACFAQRATNSTIYLGAGVDAIRKSPRIHFHIGLTPLIGASTIVALTPLELQFAKLLLTQEQRQALERKELSLAEVQAALVEKEVGVKISEPVRAQLRRELAALGNQLTTAAVLTPRETTLAQGMPALLGVPRNGAASHKHSPPAKYVDPKPPFSASVNDAPSDQGDSARGTTLSRAYHRGHATDWCNTMTVADLEALRTTEPGDKCDICVEFATRHLRIGDGPTTYDANKEPLCSFLGGSAFIYQPLTTSSGVPSLDVAAHQWCGCEVPGPLGCEATFSGSVVDSESRAPVEGAVVAFAPSSAQAFKSSAPEASDSAALGSFNSSDLGAFVSEALECGSYDVQISADGYLPATLSLALEESPDNVQLIELAAIDESCADVPSEVVGWVIDGATGEFIAGALVELHAGVDAPDGPLLNTDITDNNGVYAFPGVERGYYTLTVDATGYQSAVAKQVSACGGEQKFVDDIRLPPTQERALSFVLDWARPADLDLHLLLPSGDEISFNECAGSLVEAPFAHLDVDHQLADGSEIITVSQFSPGTYTLYVHNFSAQNEGAEGFQGSEAQLIVYRDSAFLDRVVVPSTGSGYFWDVLTFEASDGSPTLSIVNELTNARANPLGDGEYTGACTPGVP